MKRSGVEYTANLSTAVFFTLMLLQRYALRYQKTLTILTLARLFYSLWDQLVCGIVWDKRIKNIGPKAIP